MKKILISEPTKNEFIPGLIYLFLELLALPVILSLISLALPTPLTDGQLNGIYFLINFIVMVWIFRRHLRNAWSRFRSDVKSICLTALKGFGWYWLGSFIVTFIILILDPDFANVNDSNIAAMASQDFWIILVCTVALVPLTEELLFRGVIFGKLYNRSPIAAYLVSVLVFSVVHVIGYIGMYPVETLLLCFLQYIPASLALGWCFAKADNIFSPVLMHTAVNVIGVLAMR